MKRTVEIDDTLQENVDNAIEEVKELLIRYMDESKTDEVPCLNNDLDYAGGFHEIVDSCTPIYYHEIDDTWYLYSDKLEEAYENAGVGENPREGSGSVAIYYYIWQEVSEWYSSEAEDIFEEWQKTQAEAVIA